ncbi:hypothetical protein Poly41_63770 [Novipirellula artificiosorum]|uniref:Uncharacterized protein n=1 Tax=Novipirellula artificiosorum TaxID=2528016 RepID=A0A5C6D7G6_9BACT|nr:hypothetical protein Poly41_63770 [Novipirellula artificiosorum]
MSKASPRKARNRRLRVSCRFWEVLPRANETPIRYNLVSDSPVVAWPIDFQVWGKGLAQINMRRAKERL